MMQNTTSQDVALQRVMHQLDQRLESIQNDMVSRITAIQNDISSISRSLSDLTSGQVTITMRIQRPSDSSQETTTSTPNAAPPAHVPASAPAPASTRAPSPARAPSSTRASSPTRVPPPSQITPLNRSMPPSARVMAAAMADIAARNRRNNASPPVYKMNRRVKTVTALWTEWAHGLSGGYAVRDLERQWGTKWRNDDRKFFSRRVKIIKAIVKHARESGLPEETVATMAESKRQSLGISLAKLNECANRMFQN